MVGGGIAGLTVAIEAAKRGASVAVLESRQLAWSASGYNIGTVTPGFGGEVTDLIARVGHDHARELWGLTQLGADHVRALASEMQGTALTEGVLEVSNTDNGDQLVGRLQLLGESFGADVEGWQVERVREALKTQRYFHAVHYPKAFHLHALNYARGLALLAERAGVRIFEETPVVSIDPGGVRKRIITPAARMRAYSIVLAGNVHLGTLFPRLSRTLLPVWRYAAVTEPLGERLAAAIAYPRRGQRKLRHRPLPHRRRRPADVGRAGHHLERQSAPLRLARRAAYPRGLSAARQGEGRRHVQRRRPARPCTACRRSASCAAASGSRAVSAARGSRPRRWRRR